MLHWLQQLDNEPTCRMFCMRCHLKRAIVFFIRVRIVVWTFSDCWENFAIIINKHGWHFDRSNESYSMRSYFNGHTERSQQLSIRRSPRTANSRRIQLHTIVICGSSSFIFKWLVLISPDSRFIDTCRETDSGEHAKPEPSLEISIQLRLMWGHRTWRGVSERGFFTDNMSSLNKQRARVVPFPFHICFVLL